MAKGISIHIIDVSRGVPAANLRVLLYKLDTARRLLLDQPTTASGVLDHPVVSGIGVDAGLYEAEFHIGDYYRSQGFDLPQPAFLEVAVFRFGVADPDSHYHLPLKMTAWGFSLFRGGA